MAKAEKAGWSGIAAKIQRLLGTDQLGKQTELLKDQNLALKRQNEALLKLVEASISGNKAAASIKTTLGKQIDQTMSLKHELLAAHRELAVKAERALELKKQDRKRLIEISNALFELNRTLYGSANRDKFDLGRFGAAYFSQNGEDGVIQEIARRLDVRVETFVEIGAGDGLTNNSVYLLLGGARGLWVELEETAIDSINRGHEAAVRDGRLAVVQARVTAENVNQVLSDAGLPEEVDFLSIDIDGNDYWVWQALNAVSPKIVCLEYNAYYGPHIAWVKAYDADFNWSGGDIYFGASLKALEKLSRTKGFVLVGCDYSGTNAFFIREDLVGKAFKGPFTAEHLFQPNRGRMGGWPAPKRIVFGPHEIV